MSSRLFFPPPTYLPKVSLQHPVTLRELCKIAGVQCQASGEWTERQIEILQGDAIVITAEPGDWGKVQIIIPEKQKTKQARVALQILGYGMHDLVAKQSILSADWNTLQFPRGRPKTGQALTSRERQRRFREKHNYTRAV